MADEITEVTPTAPEVAHEVAAPDAAPDTAATVAEHGAEYRSDQTTIAEYLESLLVTVILALFGTSFVVPLQRGDIIVFKYPYADHQHFVKRVIGLPGDRLKLVDQEMYVNGRLLSEPYVQHDPATMTAPLNSYFPPPARLMFSTQMLSEWVEELPKYVVGDEIVVPPGKYFVMGDNRDNSSDSRFWGFVDRGAIMGRPFLIYWSVDATSADYARETNFWSRLTSVFDNIAHLPARTRWSRMLRTVH